MAKKAATKSTKPSTKPPAKAASNGQNHDFDDPGVKGQEKLLNTLLADLTKIGVDMTTLSWRKLDEGQQKLVTRWIQSRKANIASLVPDCIRIYASPELKAEIAVYAEEQEEERRVIMSCVFGKPNPQKESDEGERKIAMVLTVPDQDISPPTANFLWGRKHCKIEFSRRSIQQWKQKSLPGVDGASSRIVSCESDVMAYSWRAGTWKFQFLVSEDSLAIDEAYGMWLAKGSCVVTMLGAAKSKEEPEAPTSKAKSPLPGQKQIFDPKEPPKNTIIDANKAFRTPDMYVVPLKSKEASCLLTLGQGPNQRWYGAIDLTIDDTGDAGFESSIGEEYPKFAGDGYISEIQAMEGKIGWLVAECAKKQVDAKIINELKDVLKSVAGGKKLSLVKE